MKIVQAVGWFFPDSVGGTEVYVAALSRLLRDAGHDVLIAAPRAGADAEDHYDHDGIAVYRYPIPAAVTRAEAQGEKNARGADRFHRWLTSVRADVVHVHTFVTGLGLAEVEAARAASARVIVTTHSSSLGFLCQRGTLMRMGEAICDGRLDVTRCAACALDQHGLPRLASSAVSHVPPAAGRIASVLPGRLATAFGMTDLIARNRARQDRMLAHVDRFVVLTERARSIVVDNGAPRDKIVVNRLGVSQPARPARPRAHRRPLRVGYLGRYDAIKGVLDFAAAIRRLPSDLPITFEFRGPTASAADAATRDTMRRLTSGDGRVSFADPVAPQCAADVLASYDIACFPSRCLEGGPTAGLEAMAVGTPVIAARVGGLAELLVDGENGALVEPGDVASLVDALARVARTPALVDSWRGRLPSIRTMRDVCSDYEQLYA